MSHWLVNRNKFKFIMRHSIHGGGIREKKGIQFDIDDIGEQ